MERNKTMQRLGIAATTIIMGAFVATVSGVSASEETSTCEFHKTQSAGTDVYDLDGDGNVSISDAALCLAHYAESAAGLSVYCADCDADSDGTNSLSDATDILTTYAKIAAGIGTTSETFGIESFEIVSVGDEAIVVEFSETNNTTTAKMIEYIKFPSTILHCTSGEVGIYTIDEESLPSYNFADAADDGLHIYAYMPDMGIVNPGASSMTFVLTYSKKETFVGANG